MNDRLNPASDAAVGALPAAARPTQASSWLDRLLFWRAPRAEAAAMRSEIKGLRGDVVRLTAQIKEMREAVADTLAVARQSASAAAENKLGVQKLAVELPNIVSHADTSLNSRLNAIENEYFVPLRNAVSRLEGPGETKLLIEKLAAEIPNALAHLDSNLNTRINALENDYLVEVRNRLHEAVSSFNSRINAIENEYLVEFRNRLQELDSSLDSRVNRVENEYLVQLRNRLQELDSGFNSRLNSLENDYLVGLTSRLHELHQAIGLVQQAASQAAESRLGTERLAVEFPNLVAHLQTSLHSRLNAIENEYLVALINKLQTLDKIAVEVPNAVGHLGTSLQSRLNTFENARLPGITRQIHELAAIALGAAAARADHAAWKPHSAERYRPAQASSFKACLANAKKEFPKVFEAWRERLDATQEAFAETKVGNVAHVADVYSRLFRSFVETHIAGRVLDVGCGAFGRPYYLEFYPGEFIAGIEPLPMKEAADFELVHGIGEFLPWPDASFSTVISATSLDHSLSLAGTLAEMIRVLRPGGKLLLWIGDNPGSPRYEPDRSDFQPADKYHLFHFDTAWFEPMLAERFHVLDRLEFRPPCAAHVFYCLRPKSAPQ